MQWCDAGLSNGSKSCSSSVSGTLASDGLAGPECFPFLCRCSKFAGDTRSVVCTLVILPRAKSNDGHRRSKLKGPEAGSTRKQHVPSFKSGGDCLLAREWEKGIFLALSLKRVPLPGEGEEPDSRSSQTCEKRVQTLCFLFTMREHPLTCKA
jgi:hypothetical protein